jgi:anti-sigma B factor antagonist
MQIETRRLGDVTAVAVIGRFDSAAAGGVRHRLEALVAEGAVRLAIDLRDVAYISSAGFRVLLILARTAQEAGGGIALSGIGGEVRRLFDMASFAELFTICDTVDSAAAALRAGTPVAGAQ